MKSPIGRGAAGATAAVLMLAGALVVGSPAGAAPTGAVPFGQANFHGDAAGSEVHVGAVNLGGTTNLADLTQAFSGASTNTAGLPNQIIGDNAGTSSGLLVQPAQSASVNAYGTGLGLGVGLVVPNNSSGDQLKLAGKAERTAPPNQTALTVALPSSGDLNLPAGLATGGLLIGRGAAVYDPTQCPIGQPISYGLGNASNVGVLTYSALPSSLSSLLSTLLTPLGVTVPTTGSVVETAGDGTTTSTAQSDSATFLSSNGDGSFGLTSQAREIIAPLTLNLLALATVHITVSGNAAGTAPPNPVSLAAITTGEGRGAEVQLLDNDFLGVTITVASTTTALIPPTALSTIIGQGGIHLDLNPSTLVSQLGTLISNLLPSTPLNPILTAIGGIVNQIGAGTAPLTAPLNLSLGRIDIGTPVRAINGAAGTLPDPAPAGTASSQEGQMASGAWDLARVHVGLSAPTGSPFATLIPAQLSDLVDLTVGHLEATANLAAPITCSIPVIKTANPTSVQAGHPFTYTIQVPDPAKLALLDCNLVNITVTDTITDNTGSPTFVVTSTTVNGQPGGKFTPASATTAATVTWTGLTYTIAPHGSPPNPPIVLTINISVPSNSPAGIIQDLAVATGTINGCQGGASNISNIGGANTNVLTGTFKLVEPSVTALTPTPASIPGAPATTLPAALPFTGAIGGPWQPIAGVVVLGLGGGALALVRRSRRRLSR
jgi:hypothetical protein